MTKKALSKTKSLKKRIVRSRFKELRKAKGTQRFVAEETGVTEVTVRHIENGWLKPGADLMAAFSFYFNESVENLFPDVFKRDEKNVI